MLQHRIAKGSSFLFVLGTCNGTTKSDRHIMHILCARGGMRRVRRVRGGMRKVRWASVAGKSITNLYRSEASLWAESFEFFSDIPRTLRSLYTGSSFCKKRQRDGRNIGRLKIYGFAKQQFVFVCLGLSPLQSFRKFLSHAF